MIDHIATCEAVGSLLVGLGLDPKSDGLLDTPTRVARAFEEMLCGYSQDPEEILSTRFAEKHDELIVVKDIPFSSLCEHHLLPFSGRATVGYLPSDEVVGLSKIPRLVKCFARRLQLQERLCSQIADALFESLRARFVGVYVVAHHQCMSLRGIESSGDMVTSAIRGIGKDALKHEFFAIAQSRYGS